MDLRSLLIVNDELRQAEGTISAVGPEEGPAVISREAIGSVAERWLDAFERTGIVSVVNLASLWIPELREFRCDPRFQRFVSKLGLIDYWKHSGPPDGCDLRCGVLDCA